MFGKLCLLLGTAILKVGRTFWIFLLQLWTTYLWHLTLNSVCIYSGDPPPLSCLETEKTRIGDLGLIYFDCPM